MIANINTLKEALKTSEEYKEHKYDDMHIDMFIRIVDIPDKYILALGNVISEFLMILTHLKYITDNVHIKYIEKFILMCTLLIKTSLCKENYEVFTNEHMSNGEDIGSGSSNKNNNKSPIYKLHKSNSTYCFLAYSINDDTYIEEYISIKTHVYLVLINNQITYEEYKNELKLNKDCQDNEVLKRYKKNKEIGKLFRTLGCVDRMGEDIICAALPTSQKIFFECIAVAYKKIGVPKELKDIIKVFRIAKTKLKNKTSKMYATRIEGYLLLRTRDTSGGNNKPEKVKANNSGVLRTDVDAFSEHYTWGSDEESNDYGDIEDNFIINELDELIESISDEDSYDDSENVTSIKYKKSKFKANAKTAAEYQMLSVNKVNNKKMSSNNLRFDGDSLNIYDITIYINECFRLINMKENHMMYGLLMLFILFLGRKSEDLCINNSHSKGKRSRILVNNIKKEFRIPVPSGIYKIIPDESSKPLVYKTSNTLNMKIPDILQVALMKCDVAINSEIIYLDELYTMNYSAYKKGINKILESLNNKFGTNLSLYKTVEYMFNVIEYLPKGSGLKACIITGKLSPKFIVPLVYREFSETELRIEYIKACDLIEINYIDESTHISKFRTMLIES